MMNDNDDLVIRILASAYPEAPEGSERRRTRFKVSLAAIETDPRERDRIDRIAAEAGIADQGGKDVSALPPQGIFISYRRADAGPYARLLQVQLGERFPDTPVFMDLDSIEAGIDFAESIKAGLDACSVLVALIGPRWLTLADDDGHRRLENPNDYVRFEIRTALKRGVRVIPVLVDGAKPVRRGELPPDLRKLARLNSLEMSYDRYQYDADKLISIVGKELAQVAN